MESTEPKRHRRKSRVSAMTATLPIVEGGEVPTPVEVSRRRKTSRKRKTSARPAIVIEIESTQPPALPNDTVLDRPVRAMFAGTSVQITAIGEKRVAVAHEQPLAGEGDLILRVAGLFPELSRLRGRIVSTENGNAVIEITRNAIALPFALDAILNPVEDMRTRASEREKGEERKQVTQSVLLAQLLQEKPAAAGDVPDIIEADPQPLPHPRDIRPPLVPIVRTYAPPRRARRRNPLVAAAGIVLLIAIVATIYVKRPDDHLRRAQAMIAAYEDGLMPSERDYTLPVYANALRELDEVRPASISGSEAEKLADRIRHLIARQRTERTVNASMIAR